MTNYPHSSPLSPTSPISPWPPETEPASHPNAKEAYGFLVAVGTSAAGIIFLVWALVPGRILESWGVEWYPNREWAILIPAHSMVVVLLAYFVYLTLMIYNTPSLNSLSLVTDERAHRLPPRRTPSDPSPIFAYARPDAVPEAWDVPLGMACAMIYGRRKRPKGEERKGEGSGDAVGSAVVDAVLL
ncbi:PIG-P-domain-containing protein [Mrakia frigida]|uniref:phosphatidylinositol N-acetylglucosaminyltransferase GPI19 n=1 Tax=Mrakia frigida TaxID=29902 RepID=UPI003FCC26AE